MKNLKGYKAAAVIYLIITIVNVFWICNYDSSNHLNEKVENEKNVVVNYDKN